MKEEKIYNSCSSACHGVAKEIVFSGLGIDFENPDFRNGVIEKIIATEEKLMVKKCSRCVLGKEGKNIRTAEDVKLCKIQNERWV